LPALNPNIRPYLSVFAPDTSYNPFAEQSHKRPTSESQWRSKANTTLNDWEKLYSQFKNATEEHPSADEFSLPGNDVASRINSQPSMSLPFGEQVENSTRNILQLKNKYLITQSRTGLTVIDQHRAHVRVLFERYNKPTEDNMPSQKVMFPEIVSLSPQQNIKLLEIREYIEHMGFELTPAAPNAWSIEGTPAAELQENAGEVLKAIISDLLEGNDITSEKVREVIALRLAKATALRGGKSLTEIEMEQLLSDLFSLSTPAYTPDGLKIISEIPMQDIERLF
ncbi:MAG: hypothetical protein K2N91_01630, partial [Muribaculaceae bacterium]|nr:hypothetical protein [Muribaculaceae bacterium]